MPKKVVDKENIFRTGEQQDQKRDNSPDIPETSKRDKKRPKARVENPFKKRALETHDHDSNVSVLFLNLILRIFSYKNYIVIRKVFGKIWRYL